MLRSLLEHIVIVGSIVLIMLLHGSSARPRRRFCERYPFASMCLGVAAKRSAQQFDLNRRQKSSEILSNMIKRIVEEERAREQQEKPMMVQDKSDLYEDSPFLQELESMVRNTNNNHLPIAPTAYINEDPSWDENYGDPKRQL